MGRLSSALSSLIKDLRAPQGRMQTLENRLGRDERSELQTLESWNAQQSPHSASNPSQNPSHDPSRDELLNYLGRLANDYHLPRKVVYAVAHAESDFNVNLVKKNLARDAKGHVKHDGHGNLIIRSIDYGVMQVNSGNINAGPVKDAHGNKFVISDDVKSDWRANARAGVALLAPAYHLAQLEQGPGATMEDHAQQAYSQYNSGKERLRERYLSEKRDGMPKNDADRNFLRRYRETSDKQK
jgi:soluble lytic murein transglycosylase-like protein